MRPWSSKRGKKGTKISWSSSCGLSTAPSTHRALYHLILTPILWARCYLVRLTSQTLRDKMTCQGHTEMEQGLNLKPSYSSASTAPSLNCSSSQYLFTEVLPCARHWAGCRRDHGEQGWQVYALMGLPFQRGDKIIKEANEYQIVISIRKSKSRFWLRESWWEMGGGWLAGRGEGSPPQEVVLIEIWMRSQLIWGQVFQADVISSAMAQRRGMNLFDLNIGRITNVAWAEWARRMTSAGVKTRLEMDGKNL